MELGMLIKGLTINGFRGDADMEISELAYDSRVVIPGSLFTALQGNSLDGHHFIKAALEKGAVAIMAERAEFCEAIDQEIAVITVPDSREALSKISVAFFHRPFKDMDLIGITGIYLTPYSAHL